MKGPVGGEELDRRVAQATNNNKRARERSRGKKRS